MAVAGKVAITLSTENGGAWSADVTYDRLVAVKHNNNLYISRKTVANVEPPNDEFWFLALEGFGGDDVQALIDQINTLGDAIQDIIEGNTQVGNAKTLDGHGAEYFAKETDLANYLPLTGGTVKEFSVGPTSSIGLPSVTFRNSSNEIRQYLSYNATNGFFERYDASLNAKTMLDTGNKPSGTYTGNGSSTQRRIAIGGITQAVDIYSSKGIAHVTPNGAFIAGASGVSYTNLAWINETENALYMATAEPILNDLNTTFKYTVL